MVKVNESSDFAKWGTIVFLQVVQIVRLWI